MIIPYRDRFKNLLRLTRCLEHSRLLSNYDWEMIVVEQNDRDLFNKGVLVNVGFQHSTGEIICIHDTDMLPIEADYSVPSNPVCLISRCNLYNDSIAHPYYFGGVIMLQREHFQKVNGFSNKYHGWGAEDDDFWFRCHRCGLEPTRRPGVFFHQDHPRQALGIGNHEYYAQMINSEHTDSNSDGLNNVQPSLIEVDNSDGINYISVSLSRSSQTPA
jgi:hypothetical protein